MPLRQIISGGQTGVDRAALDVALERGLPCGGWCPLGRVAEDGVIPDRYPLQETPRADYEQRTEFNVRDADGTLILVHRRRHAPRGAKPHAERGDYDSGPLTGGTALTKTLVDRLRKPCLVIDLQPPSPRSPLPQGEGPGVREHSDSDNVQPVLDWLRQHRISILNVAGPRESQQPGIHQLAADFLYKLLDAMTRC